jgi:magnesium chelatase subunit D
VCCPRALRQFPVCYRAGAAATGAEELLEVPLPPPPDGVEPPLDGVEPPLDGVELEPEEDEPEEDEPEEPESEPPPLEPPSFLVEL